MDHWPKLEKRYNTDVSGSGYDARKKKAKGVTRRLNDSKEELATYNSKIASLDRKKGVIKQKLSRIDKSNPKYTNLKKQYKDLSKEHKATSKEREEFNKKTYIGPKTRAKVNLVNVVGVPATIAAMQALGVTGNLLLQWQYTKVWWLIIWYMETLLEI